jgi:ribosomal protein L19
MLQCANVENIRCKSLDGYAGFCPMRISDGLQSNLQVRRISHGASHPGNDPGSVL